VSAFPQDMLLYPDGAPRILNSDNRLKGEINGVQYVVDVKGGMAICAFIDPKTEEIRRMWQPRFDALGIMIACAEVSTGRQLVGEVIGFKVRPDGKQTLDGY